MTKEKPTGPKGLILVVEDDPDMEKALRDVLEEAGYRVETAADGQDGLNLFMKHTPDLILSGVDLPVLNGYQFLNAIRRKPQGKLTPFILLTAHGKREEIRNGMARGVDDYLTKPIKRDELLAVVGARLKRMDSQFES